jgi:hypothetical protein
MFRELNMKKSEKFISPLCCIFLMLGVVGAASADTVMRVREGEMSCDRACLNNFVDQYLDAMADGDPSRIPLTKDVRMTENTIQLNIGDGLWTTTRSIGTNKHYLADVWAQQAGFIGVIYEADGPKKLALRLRIKNMQIKEVEMVTARPGSSDPMGNNLENWAPHPLWARELTTAQRRPRHEMVDLANQYFEAIERDETGLALWADGCTFMNAREANGSGSNNPDPDAPAMPAEFANMGCDAMFGNGAMGTLEIPERSFWIVDEEMGAVLGAFIFSSPTAGGMSMGGVIQNQPNSGIIAEAFKIIDGKIYRLDAVTGLTYAYGTKTGW